MPKKKSLNELAWQVASNRQIDDEYIAFLQREGLTRNPDSAYRFASIKRFNGYREKSERDLILLLAGDLPYMYD